MKFKQYFSVSSFAPYFNGWKSITCVMEMKMKIKIKNTKDQQMQWRRKKCRAKIYKFVRLPATKRSPHSPQSSVINNNNNHFCWFENACSRIIYWYCTKGDLQTQYEKITLRIKMKIEMKMKKSESNGFWMNWFILRVEGFSVFHQYTLKINGSMLPNRTCTPFALKFNVRWLKTRSLKFIFSFRKS